MSALRLGLLGTGIAHSLSPRLHRAGLAALELEGDYRLYDAPDTDAARAVIDRVRSGEIDGLNVTTPFKRLARACCDRALGPAPVNTLWRDGSGVLVGASSDGPGFCAALRARGVTIAGARVAIVGTGGAAEAVALGLRDAGALVVGVVGRNAPVCAALAGALGAHALGWSEPLPAAVDLLVHATRIGHGGHADTSPLAALDPSCWTDTTAVVDLVYAADGATPVERYAEALGARVLGGIGAEMLAAQAAISLGWWTGREPPFQAMRAARSTTRST